MNFETFYDLEYEKIFRAASLFAGSPDAGSEATQEAFARAFARWRRLQSQPWVGGWVMSTALNLCRRQAAHDRRMSPLPKTDVSSPLTPPEPARVDIQQALAKLPPRGREATVLYYLGDIPVAEVAQLMDISEGAVKTHLSRSRKHLNALLRIDPEPKEEDTRER